VVPRGFAEIGAVGSRSALSVPAYERERLDQGTVVEITQRNALPLIECRHRVDTIPGRARWRVAPCGNPSSTATFTEQVKLGYADWPGADPINQVSRPDRACSESSVDVGCSTSPVVAAQLASRFRASCDEDPGSAV